MKRFILFTLIFTLPMLASAQEPGKVLDRKVDLSVSNESVKTLLKKLEELGEFTFAYSPETFDINRKVSGNFNQKSIKEVLEKVFEGRGVECREVNKKVLIRKKKTTDKRRAFKVPVREPVIQNSDNEQKTEKKDVAQAETSEERTGNQHVPLRLGQQEVQAMEKERTESISDTAFQYKAEKNNSSGTAYGQSRVSIELLSSSHLGLGDQHKPVFIEPDLTRVRTTATYGIPDEKKAKVRVPREKPPKEPYKFRIYGAETTGITRVGDQTGIIIGGRGALMLNKNFGVGLAGYAFQTSQKPDDLLSADYRYSGGYGGVMAEYALSPNKPIHVSFPVMLGVGGAAYSNKLITGDKQVQDAKAFLVLEPGAELEFNVIKFIKIAFGVSYRYTSSVQLLYSGSQNVILSGTGLNGVNGSCTIKFGIF